MKIKKPTYMIIDLNTGLIDGFYGLDLSFATEVARDMQKRHPTSNIVVVQILENFKELFFPDHMFHANYHHGFSCSTEYTDRHRKVWAKFVDQFIIEKSS